MENMTENIEFQLEILEEIIVEDIHGIGVTSSDC